MKTKEIECTVGCNRNKTLNERNLIVMFSDDEIRDFTSDKDELYKAKLIIEIPDQKITISESEFDEAWGIALGNSFARKMSFEQLKKQLGFKVGE
jgi:hypothetical protein